MIIKVFSPQKIYELAQPLGWQCQINPSTWQWEIPFFGGRLNILNGKNHQPNGDFPAHPATVSALV